MNIQFEFRSIEDLKAKIKAWEILNDKPSAFFTGELEIAITGSWEILLGTWKGSPNWDILISHEARITLNIGRKYINVLVDRKIYKARPHISTLDPKMFVPMIKFSYSE